jgi:hypothetical protein
MNNTRLTLRHFGLKQLGLILITATALIAAPAPTKITPAKDLIGFSIGEDYKMANYTQISALLKKWETESDRLKVVSIGTTAEGRPQYMAIITSPENHKKLEYYRNISVRLSRAEGLTDDEARKLAEEGKAIVWIDGGLHATETVNSQSLAEMVYQMSSRTDAETMRFLDDVLFRSHGRPESRRRRTRRQLVHARRRCHQTHLPNAAPPLSQVHRSR